MTKTKANTKKGTFKKKAMLPRGKYETDLIKPRYDNETTIRALADELFDEYASGDELWLKNILIKRKITRKQIMNMVNRSEYFSELYSLLKDIQESRLFHAGINGKGNIQQIIFALKNVSQWRNEPPASKEPEDTSPVIIVLKPRQLAESDGNTNNEKPQITRKGDNNDK